ncbi:MAG: NADH:quinone oxidoreductase [Robiginitomaculum sp.]|nr:MAG: NADH:quinone oxidoreductase [Robiginitomaculum sp.]
MDFVLGHFNYWVVISLMMTGLYVVISTGNLVKKLVGLGVFQTSVFQLYITMGKVAGGQPPILVNLPELEAQAEAGAEHGAELVAEIATEHSAEIVPDPMIASGDQPAEVPAGQPLDVELSTPTDLPEVTSLPSEAFDPLMGVVYSNPLPHVLILTAIVVGVATLAVGLALVVRIRESYGSIEETDIDEAEYKTAGQGS